MSEEPGKGKKHWCSLKCLNQHNIPKFSENKGISTEMKFFGILVLISAFIVGVVLGKISQKTKNNKKK
jgi:hypothetical protein